MKRRLLIILIFLLAGAVVNVAVAWGCCFLAEIPWPSLREPSTAEIAFWTSRTPDHFDTPAMPQDVGSSESFGVRRHIGWSWSWKVTTGNDEEGIHPPGAYFTAGVIEAGWPVIGRNGQWWMDGTSVDPNPLVVNGVALAGSGFSDFLSRPGVLPLHPIWHGFAVNTLFYAVVLWLLIPGPFVLRRFVRIKRGLCVKCGYPMGESGVCTECGHPVWPGVPQPG